MKPKRDGESQCIRVSVRTAAMLVIGNEILSGKIQDANTVALAQSLRRLGVALRRQVCVLDDVETIATEVRALAASHDFVFTSGGVGPTHDDVTIEGVARAFGVAVVEDEALAAMIRAHYGERLLEGHLRMALVPSGSTQETSEDIVWPLTKLANVLVLPGVPEIFKLKLRIAERLLGADRPFVSRAVYTRMDEGTLKPLLDAVVAAHPEVDVGSYPTWTDPSYKTKLTFDGLDPELVGRATDAFIGTLPAGEPQRVE